MSITIVDSKISTQIVYDYKSAGKRIFFLDYDGTLVSFAKFPELATIDKEVSEIIRKLSGDPENQIVIISGRSKDFLEEQFRGLKVILVAEYGYFIKIEGKNWEAADDSDFTWKENVMPILVEYTGRCMGTFIEEKTGSLVWHYRNADQHDAQLHLEELRDDLIKIISHESDLEILEGKKVLEIKSIRYDKGRAAVSLLENKKFDFILAAGDEMTDEALFKILPGSAYTIRVGLTPSVARFNVPDFSFLLKLLNLL